VPPSRSDAKARAEARQDRYGSFKTRTTEALENAAQTQLTVFQNEFAPSKSIPQRAALLEHSSLLPLWRLNIASAAPRFHCFLKRSTDFHFRISVRRLLQPTSAVGGSESRKIAGLRLFAESPELFRCANVERIPGDRRCVANMCAELVRGDHFERFTCAENGEGAELVHNINVAISRDRRGDGLAANADAFAVNDVFTCGTFGQSLQEAVQNGAISRARPVVMTALMAALGLLPILYPYFDRGGEPETTSEHNAVPA
jgi:hypothetical protein